MRVLIGMGAGLICSGSLAVPQLIAFTIDTGGGMATSVSGLTMSYTIGQCDATASTLQGFGPAIGCGYWGGFYLPECPGDFNHDDAIDFFDYLDFVDAFSAGLPEADFNADGGLDFFDYLDFVDAFSAGC